MYIETCSPLAFKDEEIVYVPSGDDAVAMENVMVSGMIIAHEIYMQRNQSLIEWIASLTHEMGHYIGDRVSFKDGAVLTPEEVYSHALELTKPEKTLIKKGLKKLKAKKPIEYSDEEIDVLVVICAKLIDILLKGYDVGLNEINFHPCSVEKMVQVLRASDSYTTNLQADGSILGVNDKYGRNIELSSIYVEIACLQIFENSLIYAGILNEDSELQVPLKNFPHQRAQNIVERGFRYNYSIPSTLDLYGIEESEEVEA